MRYFGLPIDHVSVNMIDVTHVGSKHREYKASVRVSAEMAAAFVAP